MLATCLYMDVAAVQAQTLMSISTGGAKPAPVMHTPPADANDTPEEIAKDSARDLKGRRFYNRPGATRAQYDADWQACRLIARGSRTPSGSIPFFYNPAVMSPVAAGIGGGLGGLLADVIAEGKQRRINRQTCLLIRGWRMVEVPTAAAIRVEAMTDAERSRYFDTVVGATQVDGVVTERTSFVQIDDPAIRLDTPLAEAGTVFLGKKVDAASPLVLAPGEAAVVMAFRRTDPRSAGRSALVQLARHDVTGRDLVYRPKNWKKTGDKTVYDLSIGSSDRKAPYEVQVMRVTPGDYVIASTAVAAKVATTINCFGAPGFHVGPGEVAYIGDFMPVVNAKLANGTTTTKLFHTMNITDARRTLSVSQPTVSAALKPAALYNRATYACSAMTMDRWDISGVPPLPETLPVAAEGLR
ncbi:hypothetical protein [Sphingomonas sp. Leaf17]|uniref:hypothetical protein n=1 Tax=Sphingomonas sp. Leaf17 TaxID=1735683 RepID=UPI001F2F2A5D|nr:hypothetical protein [Sphingomonas sp. Leaf17]